MSFPGKENLIFFESLATKKDDDFGINLTNSTFGDNALKDAARDNLMALMDIYAYNLTKYDTARYPYDTDYKAASVTEIFIPFEFDDGRYVGVSLTVTFEPITRSEKTTEYLNIGIKRDCKTHAEANANGKLFKAPKGVTQEQLDDERDAFLAEQGRSNPNAWAEAAYDAKRFN